MAGFQTLKGDLLKGVTAFATTIFMVSPVSAESAAAVASATTLVPCDAAYGSVAITDGDTQGWTRLDRSGPRQLIASPDREVACS